MLLRAAEEGKRNRQHMLWFAAKDEPLNPAEIAKDLHSLEMKLNRFLLFHDQQTGGIPGLNILYKGLQVRVTQKLVKIRSCTILKHSPGTVVGWELHPIDRERIAGSDFYSIRDAFTLNLKVLLGRSCRS